MSIARRINVIVLLAAPFAVGPGIVAAQAASPAGPPAGAGCAGPVDSVFAQYCEPIPTATGPRTPGPGTPALATTLPVRITASAAGGAPLTGALTHAGAKKRLLTVPAPTRTILAVTGPANANPWSLAWWLILVLALLAAALIATAVERRRRRNKPAAPPPPA